MRVKSYFSNTVEAAIAEAARELGDDALLVYSREATPETRYLGQYEVVFALAQDQAAPTTAPQTTGPAAPPRAMPAAPARQLQQQPASPAAALDGSAVASLERRMAELLDEMREHRKNLERLSSLDSHATTAFAAPRPLALLGTLSDRPGAASALMLTARLERAEMDPQLIAEVISAAAQSVSRIQATSAEAGSAAPGHLAMQWRSAVSGELKRRIQSQPPTDWRQPAARTILLIGPPGAGKTTAAMQIAARLAGHHRAPRLIAFEPRRLGWTQVLRSYASIVGAPFEVATHGQRLAETLGGAGGAVIDGAGLSAADQAAAAELERFVQLCPQTEVHLVLPAHLRTADLVDIAGRMARFRPTHLLFTHLNETTRWGAPWSVAAQTGWTLSYFNEGQQVPEDFRDASAPFLVDKLLTPGPVRPPVSGWPAPAFAPALHGGKPLTASAVLTGPPGG